MGFQLKKIVEGGGGGGAKDMMPPSPSEFTLLSTICTKFVNVLKYHKNVFED